MWPFEKRKVEIDYDELNDLYRSNARLKVLLMSTYKLVAKYQDIIARIKTRYPYIWNETVVDEDQEDIKRILKESGM